MKRIAIIGCGGVGGVAGTLLAEAGHDIVAITNNSKITGAIRESGLHAAIGDEFRRVEIEAHDSIPAGFAPVDIALFAVPPRAIVDAVRSTLPHLSDDGVVVTLSNGLVEEHALPIAGEERVIGGIVSYGASMQGPGRVRRTAEGGITLGRLSGDNDEKVDELAGVLGPVGEIVTSDNLRGARWSKLAINCAISSLGTIGGQRVGILMRHRFIRRLALEVMTEVVQIAHAEDVRLEKVSGTLDLEWMAMSGDERLRAGSASLLAKHTVLLAVGARYRKMRSSMLAAIERGREPSVDYLNGEITSRSEKHGIETPINAELREAVHAIARGEQESSINTLRDIYDRTRPVVEELLTA